MYIHGVHIHSHGPTTEWRYLSLCCLHLVTLLLLNVKPLVMFTWEEGASISCCIVGHHFSLLLLLQGWLPRYVIDQAVGGMMIQTHVKLWNYIHELYSNHSQ